MSDFPLNSYEQKGLASLNLSTRQAVNNYLTYEDTKKKVTDFIQNDLSFANDKSEDKDMELNNRQAYRDKFAFYSSKIRNYLTIEGIEVVRINQDTSQTEIVPLDEAVTDLAAEFVGFSILEQAMNDPEITDIFCNAYDQIFVEKAGRNMRWPKSFSSPNDYNIFIDRLLRINKKSISTGENKIVDFEVFGTRGNAVSEAVNDAGRALTMRKHNEVPIQLDFMVNKGLMTWDIANMLGMFIEGETNLIVAGITGSGKTTTMRGLLDKYIPPLGKRALVLEDTPELFLANPHTLALHTVTTNNEKTEVTLAGLIVTALRLKPKYIVVGEVRGPEAEAAVEGMATGHSTIFSMHAGTVIDAVNRLVTKYLMKMPSLGVDVVERIIGSAVNFVLIQDDILGIGRRVTSVTEIGYDDATRRVKTIPLVTFDFEKKGWIWRNNISSSVQNTMMRRGISNERLKELTSNIDRWIKETNPSEDKLKELQDQDRKKESEMIMDAFTKSGKSLDSIISFLKS